jgi:hypothetical protein
MIRLDAFLESCPGFQESLMISGGLRWLLLKKLGRQRADSVHLWFIEPPKAGNWLLLVNGPRSIKKLVRRALAVQLYK